MVKVKRDSRELIDDISRVVEDTIFDAEYWEWVENRSAYWNWVPGKTGWEVNPITLEHSIYVRPMFELVLEHDEFECPARGNQESCTCWEGQLLLAKEEMNRCWADNGFPNSGSSCYAKARHPTGLCVIHEVEIIGYQHRIGVDK